MSKNRHNQETPDAPLLPAYPLTLSILTLDNRIRTLRLRNATVKEAGVIARDMSSKVDVFINILDEANQRHGAFLRGEYIPSDTSIEEMVALADAWQRDNGYEPTDGSQREKRHEIFIARS